MRRTPQFLSCHALNSDSASLQTKTEGTPLNELAPGMASGLFGFLQSYGQNTLTMFGSGAIGAGIGIGASPATGISGTADVGGALDSAAGGANDPGPSTSGDGNPSSTTSNVAGDTSTSKGDGTSATDAGAEGVGAGTSAATRAGRRRGAPGPPPMYPRSTLLFVAFIAFLLGSLLRSLLSPADFIYVVTDGGVPASTGSPSEGGAVPVCFTTPGDGVGGPSAPGSGMSPPGTCEPVYGTSSIGGKLKALELAQSAGVGTDGSGWREIKRLLEIKYLVGGWDFQVAVVRRH